MRRLVLFLVQIAFMVSLEAQTFYYYKGERIPISIDTVRYTIFFSSDHVLRETGILKSEEGMSGKNFCIIGQKQLDEVGLKSGATEILSVEPVIAPSQTPVSNLFYVKIQTEKDTAFLKDFAVKNGCKVERQVALMPSWYVLSTSICSAGNSIEMANKCFETGRVEEVDPGFIFNFQTSGGDDEPMWGKQWGLEAINVTEAWGLTKGHFTTVVAVLDKGIEASHIEFQENLLDGYDVISGGNAVVYGDHGTHVAGIIAAGINGQFVAGVAPDARLMPVSHPLTATATASEELANGLTWAWQNGASVINNSWGDQGGRLHDRLKSALLEDAIEVALTQGRDGLGTIVTFASGNYNTIDYPGSSDERTICVGSIGENHERASTSGYGERLDLVAPGVNILSTVLNNTVGNKSGTSMACPHVSGVAALMLSVNPLLDVGCLSAIIDSTCQKLNGYIYSGGYPHGAWNDETGYGLLDAGSAVAVAESLLPEIEISRVVRVPGVAKGVITLDITGVGVPEGCEIIWSIPYHELSNITSYTFTKESQNRYILEVEDRDMPYFVKPFDINARISTPNSRIIHNINVNVPYTFSNSRYALVENVVGHSLAITEVDKDNETEILMCPTHNVTVNVYSLQNRVLSKNIDLSLGTAVIPVSDLSEGYYILSIVENGFVVFSDKFIIKR